MAKKMPGLVHKEQTKGEWSKAPKTQVGCLALTKNRFWTNDELLAQRKIQQ